MAEKTTIDSVNWDDIDSVYRGETPLEALYKGTIRYWPANFIGIEIVRQPTRKQYAAGQYLELSGISVVAKYASGDQDITHLCTFSPADGDQLNTVGTATITATYVYAGTTYTATTTVEVVPRILSIAVTTPPTKVAYAKGELLSLDGIVVTAAYSDESTKVVTEECVYSPVSGTAMMVEGTINVAVSYSENDLSVSTSFPVTVAAAIVTGLAVTHGPTKNTYYVQDALELAGIEVQAYYSDGQTAIVTQLCTFSPVDGTTLNTRGTQIITATYIEAGVTVTAECAVTVIAVPVSLAVTTMPTKVQYARGEHLDLTGMVVTATFNDGSTSVVAVQASPQNGDRLLTEGDVTVTLSFTETEHTVTTSLTVQVTAATIVELVVIDQPKTVYIVGEYLDLTGMAVSLLYTDDTLSDVTAQCTTQPVAGSQLHSIGDQTLAITCVVDGVSYSTSLPLQVVQDPAIIRIFCYEWISQLDNIESDYSLAPGTADATITNLYTGDTVVPGYSWEDLSDLAEASKVYGEYEDGTQEDISAFCSFSREGDNDHTYSWIIRYGTLSDTVACYFVNKSICLSGDTLITMADGTLRRLDSLAIGDVVLTRTGTTPIVRLRRGHFAKQHTKYYFSDGSCIDETGTHRFYNVEQQIWQRLAKWQIGEHALNSKGVAIALLRVEHVTERIEQFGIWTEAHEYYANGLLSGDARANAMLFVNGTFKSFAKFLAGLPFDAIAEQQGWQSLLPEVNE